MRVEVLREMSPEQVRRNLSAFASTYASDWENWLGVTGTDRASLFASTLRRWQATRPLPMRRPRAEAEHDAPYIEDLLDDADRLLRTLGDLSVTGLGGAGPAQIAALHGLWSTFLRLPQRGTASCVGVTKAILLLTEGRIGPAFDSTVRTKLGLKAHLKSPDEWIAFLRLVGQDIAAFEQRHGPLSRIIPDRFARYHVGRIYDMAFGPGAPSVPAPTASPTNERPVAGKVNIRDKLARFDDHWSPRIVGELNGQHVKLVKLLGEFTWHKHNHEDELFLVVHGRFRMDFRDRQVWLEEGEFLIVPRGVEHRPVAEQEAHVLLFEPAGTLNTGDVRDERTVERPERI